MRLMDIQQEVTSIKQELTDTIIALLRDNKMEIAKAQTMAASFLGVLPIKDYADLLAKLKGLGDNYKEIRSIYLRELTAYNESMKEEALHQIRAAIAQGNMDHAIAVAKQVREGDSL